MTRKQNSKFCIQYGLQWTERKGPCHFSEKECDKKYVLVNPCCRIPSLVFGPGSPKSYLRHVFWTTVTTAFGLYLRPESNSTDPNTYIFSLVFLKSVWQNRSSGLAKFEQVRFLHHHEHKVRKQYFNDQIGYNRYCNLLLGYNVL